ncbi:MAG: saccharopine dehydrogenase NADP-binding domain-containing protein [Nocardioidaceae bacterium]
MTDRHFIIGAGPVGRHVAELLAARGSEVVVATRSGTDTGIQGVHHVQLDASNAAGLTIAVDGASVLYNCASPPATPPGRTHGHHLRLPCSPPPSARSG